MKILLAAVIATTTITAPGMTAHASERRAAYVTVTPNPATLRPDRSTWITITANLDTTRTIYGPVLAEMRTKDGSGYNYGQLTDPDNNGTWTGKVKFGPGDATTLGLWRIETTALDADTATNFQGPTGTFVLRGITRVTAASQPKTVRKGKAFKLTGNVNAFLQYGAFGGSPGRTVKIYYRKAGGTRWALKTTAKTNAYGKYSKTIRPVASGSWQVRFPGTTAHTSSTSKTVQVRVR